MAHRDDLDIQRDDRPAQHAEGVSLAGRQERVSPNRIVRGDLLMLPEVDALPVLVERVLEAGDAGQRVAVRYTSEREGGSVRATVPWTRTVVRLGNITDLLRSGLP